VIGYFIFRPSCEPPAVSGRRGRTTKEKPHTLAGMRLFIFMLPAGFCGQVDLTLGFI